jgi:hypothetical protein
MRKAFYIVKRKSANFQTGSHADNSFNIVSKLSCSPADKKDAVWSVFKRGKRAA